MAIARPANLELSPTLQRAAAGALAPGRLGNYDLLMTLGRGGMGTVYKARHANLQSFVAFKTLTTKLTDDSTAVARFYREMAAVGSVIDPHVVRALDAGSIDGVHYLAMEFVQGIDLAQLVEAEGPLKPADACEIVRQSALGLAAIHARQLVHRDVKPSNLLLSAEGVVKVLDLGLARLAAEQNAVVEAQGTTASGVTLGTADYMAPEQAQNARAVDIRADIYSLGCTLFALLNGAPPFYGPKYTSRSGKIAAHLYESFPSPRAELHLPSGLVEVLARLVAKDRDERVSTPTEVAQLLEPFTIGCDLRRLATRAVQSQSTAEGSSVSAGWLSLPDSTDPLSAAITATKEFPASQVRTNRTAIAMWVVALLLVLGVAGLGVIWLLQPPAKPRTPLPIVAASPEEDVPPTPENVPMQEVPLAALALPIDFDQQEKLIWHELLTVKPHPYVWRDREGLGNWSLDAEQKLLRVQANGYSLLQMGHTTSFDYELELKINQPRWTSGTGLFFGHRLIEPVSDPPQYQCQVLEIREHFVDIETIEGFALRHSELTYWTEPSGEFRCLARSMIQKPVAPFAGECSLGIRVQRGQLREVTFNGEVMKHLTAPESKNKFLPVENTGGFGAYNSSSSSVFRKGQIKILQPAF